MSSAINLTQLQDMKARGEKITCVVAWDYQIARIADRAGVEIVSVGDSVGVNLWGQRSPLQLTMGEFLVVCQAVRRGVEVALLSVDFPFGPLQQGPESAVRAAIKLVKKAGADMVKLDGAADHLDAVAAVTRAGIPVFAQFGQSPQVALMTGARYSAVENASSAIPDELIDTYVRQATSLRDAGAALLNFTNSGPVVGPAVVDAVDIPVLGGHGGGPWLDGRIRMAHAAIGYFADCIDDPPESYANVATITLDALTAFVEDVRAGRQVRGGAKT